MEVQPQTADLEDAPGVFPPSLRFALYAFGALMLLMLLPREELYSFDPVHFAFRRTKTYAGIPYKIESLTLNSADTMRFFQREVGAGRPAHWQVVARKGTGLLNIRSAFGDLQTIQSHRWLCQGLREMCDFATYGDFNPMSGQLDDPARLQLTRNTAQLLEQDGLAAANQYLAYCYGYWLELGGGRAAVDNGILEQELTVKQVPSTEQFHARETAGELNYSDWWSNEG